VKAGFEILRIDDIDVTERIARIQEDSANRLDLTARLSFAVIARLNGPEDSTVRVRFRDGAGQAIEKTIRRGKPRGESIHFGRLSGTFWIEVRRIDGRIGYIAFNNFMHPLHVMKAFNEAMASFMDAGGLVIDLRGNTGGMGAMAMGMMGWLVEGEEDIGILRLRDLTLKLKVQPRPETYPGPVAVLVDGLSCSAAEFFSGGLQELGRARIFGSRTMGEVLPGQLQDLPNGDLLLFACSDYVTAKGRVLEGVGVIPDQEVSLTREALLEGRDPALEAALEWIDEQESDQEITAPLIRRQTSLNGR
jgi:carboxyl-terminal processing protease